MYRNRTPILILFSILQLIYSDSDDENYPYEQWNPNGALVQTQGPWPLEKQFPSYVRISHTYGQKVYFGDDEHDVGIITFAMCPDPNTGHRLKQFCNFPGESFPASKYQRNTLNEVCSIPVQPAMEKVMIDGSSSTHAQCAEGGHRYNFLYYRCKHGILNRSFLKSTFVYNACYNETQKQLVYGNYWIATPNLLTNRLLKGEREFQFDYQTFPYYTDFLNHFEDVAEHLYENNDDYVQRMILPPEFLPFALQRKPLYHYMNLAPMDIQLLPDWRSLMRKLKFKIAKIDESVSVTAGLLGILNNQYLGNVDGIPEIPIPNIWWILLYNRNRSHGVIIMMHNEPYDNNMYEQYYDSGNCSRALCNIANVASAIPGPDFHPSYIYCCYPYAVTGEFGINGGNNLLVLPD